MEIVIFRSLNRIIEIEVLMKLKGFNCTDRGSDLGGYFFVASEQIQFKVSQRCNTFCIGSHFDALYGKDRAYIVKRNLDDFLEALSYV